MSFLHIDRLTGLALPENSEICRDYRLEPEKQTPGFRAAYDQRTLIYDAVRISPQWVMITTPRLFNLKPLVLSGLEIDGKKVKAWQRIHRIFKRCEVIFCRSSGQSLSIAGIPGQLPIRAGLRQHFAGLNGATFMNYNNQIDWIQDWAAYHVAAHDLQSLVIFDNFSDAYSLEELGQGLADISGLQSVAIIAAPFPYGPPQGHQNHWFWGRTTFMFLQQALLNLARGDMFADARAVLNADPDELIFSQAGHKLFDAAVAQRHRMIKIHGSWVFPQDGTPMPAPHHLHQFRAEPNKKCNQKWAAAPSGAMSRLGWDVHVMGGALVKLIAKDDRFELLHCRGTNTGWKAKRYDLPKTQRQDPAITQVMKQYFPNA